MRILQVNKFLYRRGGAEAYMLDLADLQRARGHKVEFFAMEHARNEPARYEDRFPVEADFGEGAGTIDQLRATGRMFWSTSAARGIRRVIEDFGPDVAHLHNIYHQLSPSIVRELARASVPTVMTLHDYKLVCPSYQMLADGMPCERCLDGRFRHAVERRCNRGSLLASTLVAAESRLHHSFDAYRGVGAFVCPSEFLAAQMVAGGFAPDRLRHVPHFAAAAPAPPEAPTGPGPGGPVRSGVIVAGRLSAEKGIATLIEAMAHAPGVVLDVAGEGPDRAELEALARRSAPGRVFFLGRLDRAALHARFRSRRAVVVPSEWFENQPMVILEALSCATPVVGTTMGGIPELVRDGVDGLLVAPRDPVGLAAALTRICSAETDVDAMGRAGADRVRDEFGVDTHLDRLDELYRELCER